MQGIIGSAPPMQKLFKLVERVAASSSTVLIQGESGTGKELIARAIHYHSPRRDNALIPVNCGAIPEDLLESELFGHVKGAFTGAAYSRPGRFELANNGTIFLDEIGDMSPKLQVKMLRVLQEKVVEPVGAVKSLAVDVRVIAATHKNLEKEVAEGRFREDLFYRLNVVPLLVPPLRDRAEDVPSLVEHFLEKSNRHRERKVTVPRDIMDLFIRYRWPGNVRELENLVERITILADGEVTVHDLPEKLLDGCNQMADIFPQPIPAAAFAPQLDDEAVIDFNQQVENFENQLILAALEHTGWNKNKAAKILNLNRTTLVEKIKKKGFERGLE
ncbi:MAG: sigma-54-dependent Fis family transcriptional regulator [Magnetococcales bacterium]|nr:sigma-54-dependent Fis family transcriptional regulator [Magnetococcales bacterium]NGZ25729.1 sigma-54-dependent Fis family transcriptional regulator [Magnetococcales bacterium]